MNKYMKFIPGPDWPHSTHGTKVVTPDGTEIPGIQKTVISAPAGGPVHLFVETFADLDELAFLPEQVIVVRTVKEDPKQAPESDPDK